MYILRLSIYSLKKKLKNIPKNINLISNIIFNYIYNPFLLNANNIS